jgi:predicted ATPase/DNA-binding CsgD family transcriptional regulator
LPAGEGHRRGWSAPATTFIGRESELAAVGALLAGFRLVTVAGPLGVGKSRLAERAARTLTDLCPEVCSVDLPSAASSRIDAAAVERAVALALGVQQETDRSLLATLAFVLGDRPVLLVLDGYERLVPVCANLVRTLLDDCPGLRVLAVGRQPLHVPGEVVYRLEPLAVPGPDAPLDPDECARFDAVRLFAERAGAALPGFAVDAENIAAVLAICRRLDGIPLALELAAARLPLLGVEVLASRLRDALQVLGPSGAAAPPHQRTLRAALDWGHHALSPTEQLLLSRLAVFPASWSAEAAEHVCGVPTDGGAPALAAGPLAPSLARLSADEVPDLLARLIDKSLIAPAPARPGMPPRYRLYEVVRQYAAERLRITDRGEYEHLRRAHAAYYLLMARHAEAGLRGPDARAWLDAVGAEVESARAALDWCAAPESKCAELGLELSTALWWFWFVRGDLAEARERLERALAVGACARPAARAPALARAAHVAWAQGDHDRAIALAGEAITLGDSAGDGRGAALARGVLASVALDRGDAESAIGIGREVLARVRALGDRWGEASARQGLGVATLGRGDLDAAAELFEQARALYRQAGDQRGQAEALGNLGVIARERGDLAAARARLECALGLHRDLGDRWLEASALVQLGALAVRAGDRSGAAVHVRASLALFARVGDRRGVALCLERLGRLTADPACAVRRLAAAESARAEARIALLPAERAEHDDAVTAARGRLGEPSFHRAWTDGQLVPLDRAVAEALAPTPVVGPCTAAPLTTRQRQVAALVAVGLSDREIAARLTITSGAAKRHVHDVLVRVGLRNRTMLALWAHDHGLGTPHAGAVGKHTSFDV